MRHVLLWSLAIAVMVGITAEVSAGGRHGHDHDRHGHGHRHDNVPQVYVGAPGVNAPGGWWQASPDCRIERRWERNGDYRERIDCRGPGPAHGGTVVPLLQAPPLTIVIPIN